MRTILIVAFVLAVTCLGSNAWAAGFYLYEVGTPDVGLASAGYTASRPLPPVDFYTNMSSTSWKVEECLTPVSCTIDTSQTMPMASAIPAR